MPKLIQLEQIEGAAQMRSDIDTLSGKVDLLESTNIFNEVPSGNINGVNKVFTLSNTPILNSERVFLNGLRMSPNIHYTIDRSTITFTTAPSSNCNLLVDYNK